MYETLSFLVLNSVRCIWCSGKRWKSSFPELVGYCFLMYLLNPINLWLLLEGYIIIVLEFGSL